MQGDCIAMRVLPNVTLVGEATMGILSDNLYKDLPNGWEISLSNEIYLDPQGELYEDIGIPPDVEIPVFGKEDLKCLFKEGLTKTIDLLLAKG